MKPLSIVLPQKIANAMRLTAKLPKSGRGIFESVFAIAWNCEVTQVSQVKKGFTDYDHHLAHRQTNGIRLNFLTSEASDNFF